MKFSQRRNMNRLKGFTLTEILVAVLIMAIVAGSVMMLGYTYFKHFEQANEITIAKDRATMVLTYLERRILHTGLGMPVEEVEFGPAFSGLLVGDLLDWGTPIDSPEEESEGDTLRIAYAHPSGIFSISSGDISTTTSSVPVISFSGPLDDTKFVNADTNTKGWVVFPSVAMPFRVTGFNNSSSPKTIDLSAKHGIWYLPEKVELHYVRFLQVSVSDQKFKVKDITLGGEQPIVEGILGCKFSLDGNKVLNVAVVARGNRRYSNYVSPAEISGWGPVNNDWRYYYLVVINKGWRIRN